jgi:hypothetical protein
MEVNNLNPPPIFLAAKNAKGREENKKGAAIKPNFFEI